MEEKILFFRKGKFYYFIFDSKKYVCNSVNINILKEKLVLPYKAIFYGMSRAQVGRIIASLLDNTIDFIFRRVREDKDNILRFEVIFYQVSKISELYNQSNQQDNINKMTIPRKIKKK